MKVLFYTHEFPPKGGIGTYSYNICKWLARLNVNVLALAPKYICRSRFSPPQRDPATAGHLRYRYKANNLRYVRFVHPRTSFLKTCVVAPMIFRYIITFSPKIVMLTDPRAMYLYSVLSFCVWTRYIVIVHGSEMVLNESANFMAKSRKLLLRRVLKNTAHIIAVSNYTKKLLLKTFGTDNKKVTVIYNGIDPTEFSPKKDVSFLKQKLGLDNRRIILTVANLIERKGHDLVIKALPRIIKVVPDVCYVIAGSGSREEELKEMVKRNNVENYVLFVGRVNSEEKLSYYHICDVLVMPSRYTSRSVEGFGISFLEAGVMGKPVIGSRHGGIPEAIVHGKTGFLIENENIDELAEKIIYLLTNPEVAQEMGKNNRKWVTKMFNWQKCAQETLKVIKKC